MTINLPQTIGRGYKTFWNFKGRYRVIKGGRGSKKSCTAALWFIYNMMKYFHEYDVKPCVLVVRRYFNTHRDSTRAQLIWAIKKLGVEHLWNVPKGEHTLTYKPSGQKILFRGLDDPQSITSITVEDGCLCWVWWEEAFQIVNEDDFNKVDLSIRGEMPEPLFKQHTLTMNPWSEKCWIKKRFFDVEADNVLAITRNYDCNEFLGEDDLAIFEEMKVNNPRRYQIEGLGNWGIAEGLIFENWEPREFDYLYMKKSEVVAGQPRYRELYGLDFGYANDPTAFIAVLADTRQRVLYIYDEIYRPKLDNQMIKNAIASKGYEHACINADNEDPRTINELKKLGLTHITEAKKGKGSVLGGIQKLQDYKIIVHPRCENTIMELSSYTWSINKEGRQVNVPIDSFNHLMDALRYACESLDAQKFSW